jgi:hypothetical protein
MRLFVRQNFFRFLRAASLALLALAVLVNPILATAGDMHESEHGQLGHMQSVEQHAVELHEHDASGGAHEEDNLLHALMHASHCCGHLTAILANTLLADFSSLAVALPAQIQAAPYLHTQSNHFRPPISA